MEDVILDIWRHTRDNPSASERMLNLLPKLRSLKEIDSRTRRRGTKKRCKAIRESVSYRYKVKDGKCIATEPKLHYEYYNFTLAFKTFATNVVPKESFVLRGFRWKLTDSLQCKGVELWSWKKVAQARHQDNARRHYHNRVRVASAHELSEVCSSCTMDAYDRMADELSCSACSVRRMTRCHQIGSYAEDIDLLYMPKLESYPMDMLKDRNRFTPCRGGGITYPQALPCVASYDVEWDVPFYPVISRSAVLDYR